jgi:hypothetical protein
MSFIVVFVHAVVLVLTAVIGLFLVLTWSSARSHVATPISESLEQTIRWPPMAVTSFLEPNRMRR